MLLKQICIIVLCYQSVRPIFHYLFDDGDTVFKKKTNTEFGMEAFHLSGIRRVKCTIIIKQDKLSRFIAFQNDDKPLHSKKNDSKRCKYSLV